MTSHSIDQAAVAGGHRPMSLLLQALKQIESKSPVEAALASAADSDVSPAETSRTPAPETEELSAPEAPPAIASSAFVAPSPFIAETTAAPCEISIDVVRLYGDSETDSEVAQAEPFELPIVPLDRPQVASDAPATANVRRHDLYRLGEEIWRLLPDDSRAVIAIISIDSECTDPLAHEICTGLADLNRGAVLAIAAEAVVPSASSSSNSTFSDLATGRARWRDAIVRRPHYTFDLLPRGDVRVLETSSRRRLLTIWEEMGEQFAYVVLDVAAVELDQMLPILATCDAAFIAIRLNETRRDEVERFASRIRLSGCHLCGCLVQ